MKRIHHELSTLWAVIGWAWASWHDARNGRDVGDFDSEKTSEAGVIFLAGAITGAMTVTALVVAARFLG